VAEVNLDPAMALTEAINGAENWADMDIIIANAQAAQAGQLVGMELDLSDALLVYVVIIATETEHYLVTVDAAQGTVLGVVAEDID
jgi:uncharacterized membrane protein YkoI